MGPRCRLCAECSEDLISVVEETELSARISHLFQVTIALGDRLPTKVCRICCDTVNRTWEFSERVQKAQEFLADIISVINSESETGLVRNKDMVECVLQDNHQSESIEQTLPVRRAKSSRMKVGTRICLQISLIRKYIFVYVYVW